MNDYTGSTREQNDGPGEGPEDLGPLESDIERSDDFVENSQPEPLMQRRWWKWAVAIISLLILTSFTLPVLLPLILGDTSVPDNQVASPSAYAPDFDLPSASGQHIRLYDVLKDHDAIVLVFYRGYF